ncbi:MAG: NAD(P)/FAD-dependent oxidoreductase [Gammaproteobacteria bacterium]
MSLASFPRSHWLQEALQGEPAAEAVALTQDIRADVCIVGGGYTGLWTALRLKEAEPALDVVLIERDLCGSGASGRNGGFLLSWWSKFLSLAKLCGEDEALRIAQASAAAVSSVVAFCEEHGIAADIRADGWLWVASNAAQLGAWRETIEAAGRHGMAPLVEWPADEAARRCGSPGVIGAAFEAHAVRVQPAMLARGLRRVALMKGVRIYENTPLLALAHGKPVRITVPHGQIRAERVVLAMNAWAARWAEIRQSIVVVSGDMIVTPPIPDRLEAMGWRDATLVSDGRTLVEYYRTTHDGRVAFGKGGMSGKFPFGGSIGAEVEGRSDNEAVLTGAMHQAFPALRGVPAAHSWRGPIDRSKSGLPLFWRLGRDGNVCYGVGYSGNGVGPSFLGGRILSAMALGTADEWSTCPLVRAPRRDFPREPWRWLGARLIGRALASKDRADDEGRPPSLLSRAAVRLAPAGAAPFKSDGSTAPSSAGPAAAE